MAVEILSRQPLRHVILNAVKNPAYSMDESCLKGNKRFTTHTLIPAVGILPRPKTRQNDKKQHPGMSF
jgi:hypothetical protein